MKVLVLESEQGLASPVEEGLVERGHTVLRCDSNHGAEGVACRGLEMGGDCPLDTDDVDVAIVSRADTGITSSEHGALCAARQRIPLVVVGKDGVASARPFGSAAWPTTAEASLDDIIATCEEAAQSGMAHAAAVRRDLVALSLVDRHDESVGIEVERSKRRLVLTVRMAKDHPRHAAIVKAAAEALRRFDGNTAVIDVRVVC
jgi:hypothetical protein